MQLQLFRTYAANGVNGELYHNGALLCYTIELPWLNNQPNRSCIPEGSYVLRKRWSLRFKWHLEVTGVVNRRLILLHPANDATRELRGCIAPVSLLSAAGRGLHSRQAFSKLLQTVLPVMGVEKVTLEISSATT